MFEVPRLQAPEAEGNPALNNFELLFSLVCRNCLENMDEHSGIQLKIQHEVRSS